MTAVTNFNFCLKYIIVGDSSVGKSNILLQFSQKKFKSDHEITIGVEFGAKNVVIDEKVYRIQIWDTAGQETFKSITRAYYKNSVCAFLVYDITKKCTFKSIANWYEECKTQSPKTITMVLVGNKREVAEQEGRDFARKNNMLFFETSAKTGVNIEEVFHESSKIIAKKIEENFYDLTNESCGIKQGLSANNGNQGSHTLSNRRNSEKKKKGCC